MTPLAEISDEEYSKFHETLKFTIPIEGGYVNDPDDPGGETKWGISKRAYPNEDIPNLTPERAAEIYYKDYWLASGASNLAPPDCTVVFDTAVLCGVSRAKRWLRESGGNIRRYLELRRGFHQLGKEKYRKGWINRVNSLSKYVDMKKAP